MGDYGVNVQAPLGGVVGANPIPSNDPNEVSVLITGFGVRIYVHFLSLSLSYNANQV